MRVGDNMPHRLKAISAFLWPLGLALNLVLAISPLWGWHAFLGWSTTMVLLTFLWDERRSIQAALTSESRLADRLFAYLLLAAPVVGLLVNTGVALVTK